MTEDQALPLFTTYLSSLSGWTESTFFFFGNSISKTEIPQPVRPVKLINPNYVLSYIVRLPLCIISLVLIIEGFIYRTRGGAIISEQGISMYVII